MRFTPDLIIGAGLVLALILSILLPAFGVVGEMDRMRSDIVIGLVGYMGRVAVAEKHGEKPEDDKEGGKTL